MPAYEARRWLFKGEGLDRRRDVLKNIPTLDYCVQLSACTRDAELHQQRGKRALRESGASGDRRGRPGRGEYGFCERLRAQAARGGFTQLDGDARKNYTPQKGDVIIYPAWQTHTSGHMEMYDGKQWVSDFMQKGSIPFGDGTLPHEIYRP